MEKREDLAGGNAPRLGPAGRMILEMLAVTMEEAQVATEAEAAMAVTLMAEEARFNSGPDAGTDRSFSPWISAFYRTSSDPDSAWL